MNFKNALKVSFLEYKTYLKSLLYRIVLFVLFSTISYVLLKDFLNSVFSSNSLSALWKSVKDAFTQFAKGKGWTNGKIIAENFKALLKVVFKQINENALNVCFAIISFIVLGTLNALSDVAITNVFYNYMTSKTKCGFFSSMVRNFKKGIVYSIFYSLYNLLILFLLCFISIGLIFALMNVLGFFIMPVVIILFILTFSIKQRIIALVLPNMIANDANVFKSIKETKLENFFDVLIKYTIAYFSGITLNVLLFFFTFGAGSILFFPLFSIIVNVMGLTAYFETHKQKYYLSDKEIYDPN